MTRPATETAGRHGGLASDSVVVAVAQAIGMGAGLVTGIVIARQLGPSGRGIVSVALLLPSLGALVLGFGSSVSNVYLIGSRRLDVAAVLPVSIALCAIGTIIGWGLLGGFEAVGLLPHWVPHVRRELILVAAVGLPLTLLYTAFRAALRGLQRIRLAALIDIVQGVATAVATTIALVWFNGGATAAVVANLAGLAIGLGALVLALQPRAARWRPSLTPGVTREVMTFGIRGDFANLTQFFTYRFDSFLVNAIRSTSAVGIYAVATRFAELAWVLPGAVATVVVSRTSAGGRSAARSSAPRVFGAVLSLSVGTAVVLLAVGHAVITAVYSHSFGAAYHPMVVLLPGVALLGGATVLTSAVTGLGHPGYNTVNSLIGMIVTLGLDIALIPGHGIVGAAIASSIAYGINTVLAVVFFLRVADLAAGDFMREMIGRPAASRDDQAVQSDPSQATRGGEQ